MRWLLPSSPETCSVQMLPLQIFTAKNVGCVKHDPDLPCISSKAPACTCADSHTHSWEIVVCHQRACICNCVFLCVAVFFCLCAFSRTVFDVCFFLLKLLSLLVQKYVLIYCKTVTFFKNRFLVLRGFCYVEVN